jgi:iron complex outermembrane receptor protein
MSFGQGTIRANQQNVVGVMMQRSHRFILVKPASVARTGVVALLVGAGAACAQEVFAVSEKDFLSDMPIVLSVSRLPQRLDETPGAVTVFDRDTIARTGARDVADLLRWVPGFQVNTAFESGAPLVSYHGAFNVYSSRIELLIDGRSVYSPYLMGSVGPGLQAVAIDDIERIEVLRGSNSATYGARAVLGVINIVTRHSADSLGARASVTAGGNGIADVQASIGWGGDKGTSRLTVDRRSDDGLDGSNNHNQVTRLNFRSDFNPSSRDEVQLRLGTLSIDVGKGTVGDISDALRDTLMRTNYAQVDWLRSLGADEDLLVRLSHTRETYNDEFPYWLNAYGINDFLSISSSGNSSSSSLLAQQTMRRSASLRWVWGGELRSERITSPALFNRNDAMTTDFTRLFGNLEWRIKPTLLLNAGVMLENSSMSGESAAPRLMLNWQVTPEHTLRAGMSQAHRPPSTYEQHADVRYTWNTHLLRVVTVGNGQVAPEQLNSREISYLGDFPQWGLGLDVRLFHEQMKDFVSQQTATRPRYYFNDQDFAIKGLEYQLKWRPWRGAQLMLNQTYTTIGPVRAYSNADLAAPRLASSVVLFQKLPGDINLSLMHQHEGKMRIIGSGWERQQHMTRTDLRLSKSLRWGAQRGEVALVVQNLGQPYPDYSYFEPRYVFNRQAFVTLRLEN